MAIKLLPIKNEALIRKQLITLLTNIGFKDGASLTEQELSNENSPIFWEDILDTSIAQKKSYYLVFSIGSQTSIYADNNPVQTIVTINIDLFTTKDISSKDVFNMRSKLEEAIASSDNFFSIQLLSKFYDNNVSLNQISYIVQKVVTVNEYN